MPNALFTLSLLLSLLPVGDGEPGRDLASEHATETTAGLLADIAGRAGGADGTAGPARTPDSGPVSDRVSQKTSETADRIAWFGTWDQALREATRSGRPILLVSAAPHCREVSGMW